MTQKGKRSKFTTVVTVIILILFLALELWNAVNAPETDTGSIPEFSGEPYV